MKTQTRYLNRGSLVVSLALGLSLGWGLPRSVDAGPLGSIAITEKKMDPGSPKFEQDVKAATVNKLKKAGDGWKINFVAYFKKQPGVEDVNIVFYDVAQVGPKREPVTFFPMKTRPNAKIMVAEVDIKTEDGFKTGGKYQVMITRLIGGREEIYARTTVELAD